MEPNNNEKKHGCLTVAALYGLLAVAISVAVYFLIKFLGII